MTGDVADLLAALNEAPPFAALAVLTGHLKDMVGAKGVSLLLADYGERTLERLDEGRPMRSAESVPVGGSVAGRAFRRQETLVFPYEEGESHRVYVPVSIRADRLGLLDLILVEAPDEAVLDRLRHVATTLAYVIAAARPFSDIFERVRRYQRLEPAAEIQWSLLPALAYEGDSVSLAGILEPAYEFGGDNFDYAVEEGALTVSVTDAMGHGLRAALVGSLAVNALRNARRSGLTLVEHAGAANTALLSQFDSEQFVSALLARIDLSTGAIEVVNAGHPCAYLVRGTEIAELAWEADYPLGMFDDTSYRTQRGELVRGDRLVLLSDGVLEARSEAGDQFGAERAIEVIDATRALAPTEVVRLVIEAVLDHRAGPMHDDATVVCIDWKK
ncbi:MAG: serine/threonine-protein phosphatase [Actinomycetota bacterium]|nr:serine/threonine-protein phosphatase [Actinomycetota bacterium]